MYIHVKKSSELSFSPVYNETTVTNGFMNRTYIEKKFLIDLLSLQAQNKYIYFQDFYKVSFSDYFVFHAPPLYSVIK